MANGVSGAVRGNGPLTTSWYLPNVLGWKNTIPFAISKHLLKSSAWQWWCMSDFHFRCAMSKIYSMSVASISVTKPSGISGTNLGQYLPKKYARNECSHLLIIQIGAGTCDEVFVKINGESHYLWRCVDHEGAVLEAFVSKRRDRKAALKFLKKIIKRYGKPHEIVTDRLKSYRAAMKVIGDSEVQEVGRWKNNRCENSHLPFRRREQAMLKFRRLRSLQKFVSIHSSIHNHFNHDRHLTSREYFKSQRTAAIAEWRRLSTA